jgi:23S rRNA (adenine2030-N6)-methyltransferase
MNYRHAYHAGNFADCFKHALLVALLDSLARKPKPYFVLDTHAGAGWYDLDAEPSRRTAEAEAGILRLLDAPSPDLARYLRLVTELGLYPGSPALIRATMRSTDRLACCELRADEASILKRRFHHDSRLEVHRRSGWEALGALLPPTEGRGLVFIDPPFEAHDEFGTLLEGLQRGYRRFHHGIFAAWYPIKQLEAVRRFHAGLAASGIRSVVAVELHLRDPATLDRLNGCGLVVINPPYQFEDQARLIANAVFEGLGDRESGAGTDVIVLADE